ncbi:MAG: glycosyltransferase [Bacteroidetes bacterium]|nr:MAG: glycosyltransferase [Bacteroidota bacterium]
MFPEILYIQAIIIYSFRSIIFFIGLITEYKKRIIKTKSDKILSVSIVVPARNEEDNIESCIESIMSNNYPKDNFEVIVVNDRSTDKTGEILVNLQSIYSNLIVLKITDNTKHKNLRGKPGALQVGIESAKGEIIMMTDADCIVNENWIESVSKPFLDENVGLTAAVTNIKPSNGFEIAQAVYWVYMHTMACAGIGINQPLGCFGNNLSVRKSDFVQLGGFENIKFSMTEDLALQQAVFNNNRKIRYLISDDSSVETLPCKTFKEYLKQQHRWALGGLDLGWRAAIFVISSIALWIGLITSLIFCELAWFFAILFTRFVFDFILIFSSLKRLNKLKLSIWIIPSAVVFILMELFVPFLLLDRETVWKGQVFKKEKT